jgi:hypothetical protein
VDAGRGRRAHAAAEPEARQREPGGPHRGSRR